MVPSAEHAADLRQAHAGHFPGQVHGDLPRYRDFPFAGGPGHILHGKAVVIAHGLHDQFAGNLLVALGIEDFFQGTFAQIHRDRFLHQCGIGNQSGQASFQLTDIAVDMICDQAQDFIRNLDAF